LQILPRTLENEAAGTLEVFTIDADLPAHQHGQFDSFARLHRFAGAQIVVFSRGRGSNHEESRVGVGLAGGIGNDRRDVHGRESLVARKGAAPLAEKPFGRRDPFHRVAAAFRLVEIVRRHPVTNRAGGTLQGAFGSALLRLAGGDAQYQRHHWYPERLRSHTSSPDPPPVDGWRAALPHARAAHRAWSAYHKSTSRMTGLTSPSGLSTETKT